MAAAAPVRDLLIAAARQFNSGHYFEAHEVLEEGLEAVPDAMWELVVGLIQIAVGYHKASQELWSGAARMLERGLTKVEPFAATGAGLNLDGVRTRVRTDIQHLRSGRFDAAAFRRHPPRWQPLSGERRPRSSPRPIGRAS